MQASTHYLNLLDCDIRRMESRLHDLERDYQRRCAVLTRRLALWKTKRNDITQQIRQDWTRWAIGAQVEKVRGLRTGQRAVIEKHNLRTMTVRFEDGFVWRYRGDQFRLAESAHTRPTPTRSLVR